MEEDIKVIDLLELGKAVWKFKYFIVGCAIVGGVLGYGYAYKTVDAFVSDVYRCTAAIICGY